MCALYAAAKVREQPLKFNDILSGLREVLGLSCAWFEQMVEGVRLGEGTGSVILFYNAVFVPPLR